MFTGILPLYFHIEIETQIKRFILNRREQLNIRQSSEVSNEHKTHTEGIVEN